MSTASFLKATRTKLTINAIITKEGNQIDGQLVCNDANSIFIKSNTFVHLKEKKKYSTHLKICVYSTIDTSTHNLRHTAKDCVLVDKR